MPTKKTGSSSGDSPDEQGELRGSPVMDVAVISGTTFTNKSVTYYDIDGTAIIEGDISLGRVEDVQRVTDAAREAVSADPMVAFSVGITGSRFRWPGCEIPYDIDPALPNQQRVTDAIAHWEANTAFRFPLRTAANAGQHPNFVHFMDDGGCWSMVGMQGNQQTISLGTGCSTGNAIHEIGHAVGLWHEQSREDRDLFVTINWANIQSGMAAQFNQHITDGDDLGAYDYGSIMHYPRTAFSKNGQETITPTDPNAQIGQRNGLSPGDIAGVQAMYPACRPDKAPWMDGPLKIFIDRQPQIFKKFRDDELVLKPIRDVKGPRDLGPVKVIRDPMPPIGLPEILTGLGAVLPFSIATPHHAALSPAGGSPEAAGMGLVTSMQRQLLDAEAAIAQARATAAQANAEIARLQEASDAVASAYEEAMRQLGGS